jgi:hypothetical protein
MKNSSSKVVKSRISEKEKDQKVVNVDRYSLALPHG